MALIGAFTAFKKSNWVLALVGTICAIVLSIFAGFGIPALCCLNWLLAFALFVLAVVACILVAMAKDEFKK